MISPRSSTSLLEVNSLTLVVGLVDSSLISFLLKLLQRGLTLASPLIKVTLRKPLRYCRLTIIVILSFNNSLYRGVVDQYSSACGWSKSEIVKGGLQGTGWSFQVIGCRLKVKSYKPKPKGCRISSRNQTAGSAKEKLDSAPTVKNVVDTASQSPFLNPESAFYRCRLL